VLNLLEGGLFKSTEIFAAEFALSNSGFVTPFLDSVISEFKKIFMCGSQ
jgi:hypothetical protein